MKTKNVAVVGSVTLIYYGCEYNFMYRIKNKKEETRKKIN